MTEGSRGGGKGWRDECQAMKRRDVRSSERRRDRQDRGSSGFGVLFLNFGQMGQEFVLVCQTGEVMADHLVRPQCRFATRPQADEHAGDDRTVALNLDAHWIVG